MTKRHKRRILLLLIIGAITCYLLGYYGGAATFLIVGALFEIAFWIGVFHTKKDWLQTPP